jgi:RNA polymerase sigma factor (sigma-70 family)
MDTGAGASVGRCNETGARSDIVGVRSTNTVPRHGIEDMYRAERLGLVRLAFLLTGSRDLAEDLVQTAFAAAQDRWSDIDEPLPYLRRVIVNQANEAHRQHYRRPPEQAEPVTHQPEVDETWSELLRLPSRQRAVVVLRFYEDLALTEIARLLDRPAGTVRSDLHRALETLRRTLR